MPENETYLADGLYASFDGFYIWLRAERDGQQHRVALDPETWNALQDYVIELDKLVAKERQNETVDQEPSADSETPTSEPAETTVRSDADEPDREHPAVEMDQ